MIMEFLRSSYGVPSGQGRENVGRQSGQGRESPIKILGKSERISNFHNKDFTKTKLVFFSHILKIFLDFKKKKYEKKR